MSANPLCGCCTGITTHVTAIHNRANLTEVAYRIGTWADFKSNMLDALSTSPQLLALKTRSDDDFTIALLDAWAIVCDILTFYSERSANEKYLGTATQRVSVAELAKLIGYRLAPGVAASAALAFTIEEPPAALPAEAAQQPQPVLAPDTVPLDAGTQVQSVPGPGEVPVTFETVAAIQARFAWNALRLRSTRAYDAAVKPFPAHLRLQGAAGTLETGDVVLLVATAADGVTTNAVNRVASVTPDTDTDTMLVTFETGGPATALAPDPAIVGKTLSGALGDDALLANVAGTIWRDQTAFAAQAVKLGWDLQQTEDVINAFRAASRAAGSPALRLHKLGVRASIFGHNAPPYQTIAMYPWATGSGGPPANWEGTTVGNQSSDPSVVYLDAEYLELVRGSRIVLQDGTNQAIASVTAAASITRANYMIAAKVTQLTLDIPVAPFGMRSTAVYGSSEVFDVAEELLDTAPIGGATLELATAQLALKIGQELIVTGTSATTSGRVRSELRAISALALIDGYTRVTLDRPLDDTYVWNSVTINANVAPATHGESRSEILGSGDARLTFQRFVLKQPPLTFVSAATPALTASTLTVRVNGEAWAEVPWLFGHGPTERVYTTSVDEHGNDVVQFGDGVNGVRLTSGENNVIAFYRQGIGGEGNVGAGRLSTLLSQPLGLEGALNPLPASGGGDPETLADGRRNAPFAVRALERIVSLDDFGDFARAGAAVAKAEAVWAWDGRHRVVSLSIAGPGGAQIDAGAAQFANLKSAIAAAGDGTARVAICSYVPRTFTVAATLFTDPLRDAGAVVRAAKDTLRAAFAFETRRLMQPVYRSEVIATLQAVTGVVAVRLDRFAYSDAIAAAASPVDGLIADPPKLVAGVLVGAELLTLEDGPLPGVVAA
jgi:predicted phage baseplate assembly protein